MLVTCNNSDKGQQTFTEGTTEILVDDTFKPIIDAEWTVFKSAYPKSDIHMIYKPENEVLNTFLKGDRGVAIISRELTSKEKAHFENKKIVVRVNRFAVDAIALIVNTSAPDSVATVEDIIKVMEGRQSSIGSLVFDNANSSTVRYLKQLANIKALPAKGVYALKSNPEVIKYVYDHPGTIGVVGVNWLEQPDSTSAGYISSIRTLSVKNIPGKPGSDAFYQPDQTNIALKLYPLIRGLYIVNCSGGPGLGTGFAAFLAGERGQRIVLKSGLLPDSIPSREIFIKK
jgi:phosphate transport system substrate-binding protein